MNEFDKRRVQEAPSRETTTLTQRSQSSGPFQWTGRDQHGTDAILKLKAQKDLIEATLTKHFNFRIVQILDVTAATRGLTETTTTVKFRFAGQGIGDERSAEGLQRSLQKALSGAKAGLVITEEAAVEWLTPPPTTTDDSQFHSLQIVLTVATGGTWTPQTTDADNLFFRTPQPSAGSSWISRWWAACTSEPPPAPSAGVPDRHPKMTVPEPLPVCVLSSDHYAANQWNQGVQQCDVWGEEVFGDREWGQGVTSVC